MIITLVGVEVGKITATARGCLKPKAKLRYAAEPFNFGEYVLMGRGDRYVVAECSQIENFSSITSDIDRFYVGCAILDSLSRLTREPQAGIFMSALKKLGELAYEPQKDANVIYTEFIKDVLVENGILLDFAHCNVCKCYLDAEAYFSDSDGIVCEHCKGLNDIAVDSMSRAYLCGADAPASIKAKANILLANIIHQTSGVKLDSHYFTEQL